jgi:Fe2+ transport system protein FeoA
VKTLDKLIVGEKGIVKQVTGEKKTKRRLFDMGITPGVEVYLRKRAPLGDPMEITLRGYELTLRNEEAKHIEMEGK